MLAFQIRDQQHLQKRWHSGSYPVNRLWHRPFLMFCHLFLYFSCRNLSYIQIWSIANGFGSNQSGNAGVTVPSSGSLTAMAVNRWGSSQRSQKSVFFFCFCVFFLLAGWRHQFHPASGGSLRSVGSSGSATKISRVCESVIAGFDASISESNTRNISKFVSGFKYRQHTLIFDVWYRISVLLAQELFIGLVPIGVTDNTLNIQACLLAYCKYFRTCVFVHLNAYIDTYVLTYLHSNIVARMHRHNNTTQHSTAQHNTAQHNTIQYNIAQHNITLHFGTYLYSITWHNHT